jgi:hypothetical protein
MRADREKETPTMTREQYIAKLSADPRFALENFSSNSARIRAIAQSEDYKIMKQCDIAIVCRCTSAHVATALATDKRKQPPTVNLDSSFNTPYQQFNAPIETEDELENNDNELDQELVNDQDELENNDNELDQELVNDEDELENEPQLVLDKHTKKLFRRVLAKRIAKLKIKLEKLEKIYTDLN